MRGSIIRDLVKGVAKAEGVEPTNLDYNLQEYIPLDAIEQLANQGKASWTLSFELPKHHVTVTSNGLICVNRKKKEIEK